VPPAAPSGLSWYGFPLLSTPERIIAAFDDVLDYVYGHQWGRDNPHASDFATATRWCDLGLTASIACCVFYRQMSLMHERWLRDEIKNRSNIPHSLKVFNDEIEAAIHRVKHGELSTWELSDSLWLARLRGWKKNPDLWPDNMWGPPPGHPQCRAPKRLMQVFA
jgi:hypothetical protein